MSGLQTVLKMQKSKRFKMTVQKSPLRPMSAHTYYLIRFRKCLNLPNFFIPNSRLWEADSASGNQIQGSGRPVLALGGRFMALGGRFKALGFRFYLREVDL